ncbi:hypothetical protein [Cohnella boryungensis]|uniref:Uncharacterized protein n=1 Tax=Cohnella boryungensis TaxID=768479 RepID=A0ABV8SDU7_9BACL
MSQTFTQTDGSHAFLVEINISAPNRGAALKQLLQELNKNNFDDYRIVTDTRPAATEKKTNPPPKKAVSQPTESPKPPNPPDPLELRIRFFIETSKLIRININKGRGVKLSIPCRILNYDSDKHLITVYHVDEKQVYTVGLNEIDDFIE